MTQRFLQEVNRAPKVSTLPDYRLRTERRFDIVDFQAAFKTNDEFLDHVRLDWGTQDPDYPECRLIAQDIVGSIENPNKSPNDPPPYLLRVYEEIDEEDETQVGNPAVTYDQDNILEVGIDWLQFSTGAPIYQVPGTDTAPAPFATAILKEEIRTNDGTLQRIRRNYIANGRLSDVSELRFGGNVIIRTITNIGTSPPATPAGFSLVGPGILHPDGRQIYTYQYAAAAGGGIPGTAGQISIEYSLAEGGTTSFDPDSPNTSNGVTIAVLRYVTPLGVTENPIPTPSGFVLIKIEQTEDSGYILWTGTYARGQGQILNEIEIKEGGKLYLYHRVSLDSAPSTPSASIGGTVTLVSADVRQSDGYVIYDYHWAEGIGEIDRNVEYFYSPDQGTTGITRTTIKYLSSLATGSNPISGPGGSELVSVDRTQQDGYQIWTAAYAQGTGIISDEQEIHQGGKLVIYKRTAINAVPATPSATIGGTVTLIDDEEQNGTRIEDGTKIFRRTWAEANGTVGNDNNGTGDGSIIYRVTTLTAGASTPAYPGSGTAYLINLNNEARDGYYLNTATYHKPPETVTLKQTTQFEKPGAAVFTGSPPQLVLTPPVTLTLLADMEVSYDTSQITDAPFTVSAPASFFEAYTPTATGIPVTNTVSLGRYLAGASSISGSASPYNGVLCDTWAATLVSSTPSTFPSGATVLHTDNEIYLVALDGTVVYRRRKVSYTF